MLDITMFSLIFLCFIVYSSSLVVLDVDFDTTSLGTYTEEEMEVDFTNEYCTPEGDNLSYGRGEIVAIGSGNNYMKVFYPEGEYGNSETGVQWKTEFTGDHTEVFSSYRIKFEEGYDSENLGGKLPGLCGKECPSGGDDVTGSNGFSARYMFREENRLAIYCYHMDKPGTYGEYFYLDYTFVPGQWFTMEQRVTLNQVGEADGEIEVWIDGVQKLLQTGLRFRDVSDVYIDHFYLSTFFGGGDSSWAPSKDEYIYFDDFVVSDQRIWSGGDDDGDDDLSSLSVSNLPVLVLILFIVCI